MKKLIIVLSFLLLLGCQETIKLSDTDIQKDTNIPIDYVFLDTNIPDVVHCLSFTGVDGRSAHINFGPDGVSYDGNIPVQTSARIFFKEFNELLCDCYCGEGTMAR